MIKSFFIALFCLCSILKFYSVPVFAESRNPLSCLTAQSILAYYFNDEKRLPQTASVSSPFIVMGTFLGAIKPLNDSVFNGATLKSQVLAEIFHALIFDQLRSNPQALSTRMVFANASVPFPKEMHLMFYNSNEQDFRLVADVFSDAHKKATKLFLEFLKDPLNPKEIDAYLNFNSLRDHFYKIDFSGTPTIAVTPFEIRDLIVPDLVRYFGSLEKFAKWMSEKYKLGIGPTRAGAIFAARSIGDDPARTVEIGTIQRFIVSFREVFTNYQKVSSLMDDENFATAIFSQARKNKNLTPISSIYSQTLQKLATLLDRNLEDTNTFLQRYILQLNIFDALKPHYAFSNPNAEANFDQKHGTGMVLHFDIRNLGAKGYVSIQKQLPRMQKLFESLTELAVRREKLFDNQAALERIDFAMLEAVQQLSLLHQNSLEDANIYLTEKFNSINAILNDFKGRGLISDYVFWKSGDDAYYKVLCSDPKIYKQLYTSIIADQNLNKLVRLVGRQMAESDYPLSKARQDLAFLLDNVKIQESSGADQYLYQQNEIPEPVVFSVK